jgi:SRSO17 transposase
MGKTRGGTESRLGEYLERLGKAIGHADRREPLRAYVQGLLLPGERKSVEPMAARVDPGNAGARHQSMHHFVARAPWDADAVMRVARDFALQQFERHAPVQAWVIDDTGIPKKGSHSVGVGRQYCGVLGKQDNCQVAVSISLTNDVLSVPGAYRLYLPESWAEDPARRRTAGIPTDIRFQKKWQIALDQVDELLAEEIPVAPIVMDAGYGVVTEFRDALAERGLGYVAGIQPGVAVWPEGEAPLAPKRTSRMGRPPTRVRRTERHAPVSVREHALALPASAWRSVGWRPGTRGTLRSRFAAVRVRPAHRDYKRSTPRAEEWLLIEWPRGEAEPTKYWLANLSESASLRELVRVTKIRWRIERDYQELKDELGLDHYEGRGWLGFHHHAALCIAAYAFLVAERARLSPPAALAFLKAPPVPKGFRPRGSPDPTGTP